MAETGITSFAERRYAVERLLGRGGMAAVYLARDRDLDRAVAVKVLADPLALDEEFSARFRREAKTAAQLSHPNIVQVYDTGEEEGRIFIVMEYVEGESLDGLLARDGKVPPSRAIELGVQVCSALHHAHGKGVVHRDVKPGNLLLRSDGIVKVADFGIARPAHGTQFTQAGTILGTAGYLPPEVVAGETATTRSDLYSLGVVLYELLTGRPPYRIESLAQLARSEEPHDITALEPAVPARAAAAVMRCLAHDPRSRPASAADLAEELGGDVRTGTVTREPERPTVAGTRAEVATDATVPIRRAPVADASRRVTRGPRTVALVAALVVAAASGIGLAFAATREDGERAKADERSVRVDRVPRSESPAQQARNLAEWIREHSEGGG